MTRITFSEFADDEHRAQAEELLLELGRFAVAFERVCEAMRQAIVMIFRSEGLTHQNLAGVIVGDKASAELQVLLGALFSELRARNDAADFKAVHDLLRDVKQLTEERNTVIHTAWRFGNSATIGELYASAIRPRTKQKQGAVDEVWGMSASYLRRLICRSVELQAKLQRLHYCILERDCKVAVELGL